MNYCFSLILTLIFIQSYSQSILKVKWGEISQEEIQLSSVEFEKDADVVILYEKGNAIIGGTFQNHVYRRVKILTDKGLDFANQELMYYSFKNIENISNLKAQTLNIVNGKPEISTVDKNSIFDVQVNEYYHAKRFAFPNVKVGSILEYEYKIVDQNIHHIDAWQFQHEYPTLFSHFSIENKMQLNYNFIAIGDKIIHQPKLNTRSEVNSWFLKNLPSYGKIDYLHNAEDMAERIIFQLNGSSYSSINSSLNTITTWKELKQNQFNYFQEYLNNGIGKEIANQIPKGNSELENLENIYQYFKSNYRWNSFIGISPKLNNRQLQKEKLGNQADLNLLLQAILTNSGFTSELILLSNRSNGRILTGYPYLGSFNMLVNLVTLKNGATYLIDAARMNGDLGYAPKDIYNYYAVALQPFDESFISLKQQISENLSLQNFIFHNGKWNLIRTDKRNGYFKENLSENSNSSEVVHSMDLKLNEIKKENRNLDEKNYRIDKTQHSSESLIEPEFILIENPLKNIISKYTFTELERERYLEFDFPFYYKTDVIVKIPDGYKVEIPADFNQVYQTETKQFIYNQTTSQQEDNLIVQYEFYLKDYIVTDKYLDVKSFFEKVNLAGTKTLLLKKLK